MKDITVNKGVPEPERTCATCVKNATCSIVRNSLCRVEQEATS
jgi:hypothetical protein